MCHVAHQTICMQYILELSNQMDIDPRACVGSFFTKYVVFLVLKSHYFKVYQSFLVKNNSCPLSTQKPQSLKLNGKLLRQCSSKISLLFSSFILHLYKCKLFYELKHSSEVDLTLCGLLLSILTFKADF